MSGQTELSGEYGIYVDGEMRAGGEDREVRDPGRDVLVAVAAKAGREGVDAAVDAAVDAQDEWQGLDRGEVGRILNRIAAGIRERADELARIETLENGRPLTTSRILVQQAADYFEYYGGMANTIQGDTVPLPGNKLDYTRREPLGVSAHVVPWNGSLVLCARGVAPALACQNTVVVKPDPKTPLSVLELGRIASEAGLPDGVLNVTPGSGNETGQALIEDHRVDGITFTGSTGTGTHVMQTAAERIVPVELELGGKSPSIVYPDADLDRALEGTLNTFWNAGQVCFNTTRVFVHADVYDAFTDRLVAGAEDMTIGPGIEDPDLGPLVTTEARDSVASYVEDAVAGGGRLLTGGSIPRETGAFYEPTVIDQVDDDAAISCDEVFGPVITLYEFTDDAEAIRRANDTDYGLYSAVYTQDLDRAHNTAAELEAGTVAVNEFPLTFPQAPFGGYKKSGIGREKGVQAIDRYSQLKNVAVSLGDSSLA
jgi:aldehyde dehydrogenase (NAD+)